MNTRGEGFKGDSASPVLQGDLLFKKREREREVATDADAYRGRQARREDTRRLGLRPLGLGRVVDDLARVRDFGMRAPPKKDAVLFVFEGKRGFPQTIRSWQLRGGFWFHKEREAATETPPRA